MEKPICDGYGSGSEILPRKSAVKMNSEEYFVVTAAEEHRPMTGCVPPALDALQTRTYSSETPGGYKVSVSLHEEFVTIKLEFGTSAQHNQKESVYGTQLANFWYLLYQ